MNALIQAINEIKKPLQSLPYDEFGAVQEHVLAETIPGWHDLPTPTQILSELLPDVGEDVSPNWLGSYRPMASPGLITLYVRNLERFYWSVVREMARRLLGFPFHKLDLEFLVTFIVEKTWHHELFHHSMEVLRRLVNGQPYGPQEEALAVAYSRKLLRESAYNSKIGRLGKVVFNLAMEIAFDGYAPPYRDWPKYDSPESLHRGIADLLQPAQRGFLESSGVPVEDLLVRLIPVQQGFDERIG